MTWLGGPCTTSYWRPPTGVFAQRLLLDDMDTAGKETTLFALDAHPNIEIRRYNPFKYRKRRAMDFLVRPFRVNHRMHNKALIADNQAVILGGRNIGDEYFSVSEDVVRSEERRVGKECRSRWS